MSASARYIITADDKTKNAIDSARRGFRNLESGVRGTVTRLNLALGVLTGVGLKRTLQNVFTETAKGSKEFADSLGEVKTAFRGLLAAHDGAPGAAKALKDLAGVLKDPGVKAAADALISGLITGFAAITKGAAATISKVRELGVELGVFEAKTTDELATVLDKKISQLEEARKRLLEAGSGRGFIKGEPSFSPDAARVAALEQEIAKLKDQAILLRSTGGLGQGLAGGRFQSQMEAAIARGKYPDIGGGKRGRFTFGEISQTQKDFQELGAEFDEIVKFQATLKKIDEELTETVKKSGEERIEAALKIREVQGESYLKQIEQQKKLRENEKEILKEQAERWRQTWANIFQNWYLGGERTARNLAKAILAQLASNAFSNAITSIFDGLGRSGGGGKFFGWLSGLLAPRADGGPVSAGKSYLVGERGPEMFVPGKSGSIVPNGAMGGATVVINNYMDNRGASQELITRLPAVLKKNNEKLTSDIIGGIRSGKYPV